ncbi:hypothetical protein ACNKHM_22340 [Shigella sonnei]
MEVIREELELVREQLVTNVVQKSPLTAPSINLEDLITRKMW